ncbi:galactose mutarotase-like protein [Scenedesmus sp. NREL 46B-D3]|nr:galactose mutarotase-like protein [Scenedesmus sp. NREL 46B-D3]
MPVIADESNGMEKLVLKSEQGATAEVYLHGAHVVSWKDAAGKDLMFTSKQAVFKPPKAIRGGVPVCFPQFGQLGPLGQHGFARNSKFDLVEETADSATLVLKAVGDEDEKFPYPFELTVRVQLGQQSSAPTLKQELAAKNTGTEEISFTTALHTYFKISTIDKVAVSGLDGLTYADSLQGGQSVQQSGDVIFDQEVDRIYLAVPDSGVQIRDSGSGAVVEVHKAGFPDAVVWNPWVAKSQAMGDFGDEEYKEMLCIEPAVAGSGPYKLAPGQTWSGSQTLVYKAA